MPESVVRDLEHLRGLVGQEVAVSDWFEVTQERINLFADATGDRQWIHVDPARARAETPWGNTIAHGFLTLSLLSPLAAVVRVPNLKMAVNYGFERVRFIAPVPSGSRIRARFTLRSLEQAGGAFRAAWAVTVELEGAQKPCCAAEWLVLYYR